MLDENNRRERRAGLRFVLLPVALAMAAMLCAGFLMAQAPAPKPSPAPPAADLNQLMRALFFPNSNVVFFTQRYDPAKVKPADEPSGSTDPLTGVFSGWEAVQNAALTLADSSDLLLTPGRKCSNDRDVPVDRADWVKFVEGVRSASMVAYKASLTKNQDKMLEASDVLAQSCSNCHNKYRPGASANRCK